jgi:peptide-methionine (S)-S-oxide reductase
MTLAHRRIVVCAAILAIAYGWLHGAFNVRAAGQSTLTGPAPAGLVKATFAAGCFWCVESDFDKVPGVVATISGYTGSRLENPSYEQVSAGGTGHAESVEVLYDPEKVTYEQLLDHFWHNVDPLNAHGQFCDNGDQYRPVIFYHDEQQRQAAEASKARAQQRFKDPVVVQIVAAGPFYKAEEYHQDYYKKNPVRYRYYRWGCGRDQRLKELWGKTSH